MKWLIPALMVLLLGTIIVAVLYATEESAAQQSSPVEIDIDRSKPRPELKQQAPKPAPRKR